LSEIVEPLEVEIYFSTAVDQAIDEAQIISICKHAYQKKPMEKAREWLLI
jgi:hypothetical protein